MLSVKNIFIAFLLGFSFSCNNQKAKQLSTIDPDSVHSCMYTPERFINAGKDISSIVNNGDTTTTGMVYIPGGTFMMGADNNQASADEYPKHKVQVAAFFMDETEVTNAQFKKFVEETGYVTIAERKPDWEELKKTL